MSILCSPDRALCGLLLPNLPCTCLGQPEYLESAGRAVAFQFFDVREAYSAEKPALRERRTGNMNPDLPLSRDGRIQQREQTAVLAEDTENEQC